MNLFAELQRRNVFRVAIAYIVAAWVLLQVADVIAPILELPEWAPKLILVILAIGLVPALIFAWAFELTPEGIKRESEVDRSASIATLTARKLNIVITVSLVAAVALLLLERQLGTPPAAQVDEEILATAITERSIAVLPFVNMSSDVEQEHFSDGITEEILNALASVKELKVAGRTSSFAFKGQADDLRRIGDALGVAHILEGSVRKSGDQVRITAQLIHVDDGFHMWSETYDRKLDDVFAIQDEISKEILRRLRATLLDDGDTAVVEAARTSPVVYELYLRARQRIYTRDRAEIEMAIEELDQAIRLDGEYAPAYAQRGIATMLLSETQYGETPGDEANRAGKRFIDIALELDPNLAEAWAGLGLYESRDGARNSDRAIDALSKALELNPNLIDASNWLHISLGEIGNIEGALEIIEQTTERDPLYRPAFSNAITLFNSFGQTEKAETLIRRMESFDPENPDLLMARAINAFYSGRWGEGLMLMEERSRSDMPMSGIARIYLSVGLVQTLQFERLIEEGSFFFRADALYEVGRDEEAFELAYEQARAGFPGPLFNVLIRSGRYQDLVDFFEERWPNIAAFAREYPGEDTGYRDMIMLATAYGELGNEALKTEALDIAGDWMDKLREQGADNPIFDSSMGEYHTLRGDFDAAFDAFRRSTDRGYTYAGKPELVIPALQALVGDPRFDEVQLAMLANTNVAREAVGLPPLDENYAVIAN